MLGFVPVERPRVVVAQDASVAAVVETTRATVIDVDTGEPREVIALDGDDDVAWSGTHPVIVSREAVTTRVRVHGTEHEARLDGRYGLRACVGAHVLLGGDGTMQIVSVSDAGLESRLVRTCGVAGVLGARFVLATGSSLVEWDPVDHVARRSWRVPAGDTVAHAGGTGRLLWRHARARIDVTALVHRGQPRTRELPEPIVHVCGDGQLDLVACLGASGRVHVVDLDGSAEPRELDITPCEAADAIGFVGGMWPRVIVAAVGRPTTVVPVTRRRFAPVATWREELIAWTRSGVVDRVPLVPAIERLARQHALPEELLPAVTLCYGAHLCGAPGVPAEDLDDMLGRRWPHEVRGAGQLAASGLLVFGDPWITLAPAHCRSLDEA